MVICAYTEQRWIDLCDAATWAHRQTLPPDQVVVVIDHNAALLARARGAFVDTEVVGNEERQGLAGARNAGITHALGDVIALLEDDARTQPDWLEGLVLPYADLGVCGTGGVARPNWTTGLPSWFPVEFPWMVGCSFLGLPETVAPIRNPIGAEMSFSRSAFDEVGGFDTEVGRGASVPLGARIGAR
jgi:glycosyltransferase involved in cell wall biosynthesis